MSSSRTEIEARVLSIVADALDQPAERVTLDSSLVDDLGAESIDFLDIVFRLESAFGLKIPEEEIWAGSFDGVGDDPGAIAARIEELKARRPAFRWDRVPARPTRADLPRLITVGTVVEYLEGRLAGGAAPSE
ncbi:MAG: acyl carrier protein [Thermoanaerobaculia bacterium]|mgnify:CR=1 FL=1